MGPRLTAAGVISPDGVLIQTLGSDLCRFGNAPSTTLREVPRTTIP